MQYRKIETLELIRSSHNLPLSKRGSVLFHPRPLNARHSLLGAVSDGCLLEVQRNVRLSCLVYQLHWRLPLLVSASQRSEPARSERPNEVPSDPFYQRHYDFETLSKVL